MYFCINNLIIIKNIDTGQRCAIKMGEEVRLIKHSRDKTIIEIKGTRFITSRDNFERWFIRV